VTQNPFRGLPSIHAGPRLVARQDMVYATSPGRSSSRPLEWSRTPKSGVATLSYSVVESSTGPNRTGIYSIKNRCTMTVANKQSGTNVHEVSAGIYRINTPVGKDGAGGFSFNQYLIVDDEPLLFHTGLRKMFPLVREAVASVLPTEKLRYIAFSHVEADECGSLNEWLDAAPRSVPLCSTVAAMVSINDLADRTPTVLSDGELVSLGVHSFRWLDTPHLPHAWECGFLMDEETRTLLCGDLFTQGGADLPPITESDILGPSEEFRHAMDYFSHTNKAREMLEKLASTEPTTLACMHGSAWKGDGASLLRLLADQLES